MSQKPKPKPITPLQVKLPTQLHAAALSKSKSTGISIAFVLRSALEKWVKGETQSEKSDT